MIMTAMIAMTMCLLHFLPKNKIVMFLCFVDQFRCLSYDTPKAVCLCFCYMVMQKPDLAVYF